MGSFRVAEAREASGLVSSRRHDDVLYVLDDGPGTTGVLAISARDARIIGRIEVEGLAGIDTEALAAGPCGPQGGRCVYIGDIGDNLRQRNSVAVHRFREPRRLRGGATVAAQVATVRYPDEPRDAEALLVDGQGRLGIVTKSADDRGSGTARLFVAAEFGDATLADRGPVDIPAPALPLAAAVVGNVVTGGDWAPGRVVLRTYDGAVEFRMPRGRGGVPGFADWPVSAVATASEQQGEAIAYGPDGCSLYTVSEGSGALSVSPCR